MEADTPRLGWARILAIALSDCVVGFAVFFAAYVGLRGAATIEPQASSVLQTPQWGGILLAMALVVPPAAVAVLVWIGSRKGYVWMAAGSYLLLSLSLGLGVGLHLTLGVLPTVIVAGLYSLPRRGAKPQRAAQPDASPAQ